MEDRALRLLIVEDSEDDTLLLLRALQREGRAVDHRRVESRAEMSAALAAGGWDAVISDYALPQFGAPQALALFREQGLDIPFLVVSGAVGEEAAVAVMKAGAHDFVAKSHLTRLGAVLARELADAQQRQQAAREKAHLEAQLLQAQKMEAIGVLAAGIAHDFNNLLGAIQIFADIALMKSAAGGGQNELRQILGATDRAAGLTRQLLLFSRKQPLALVALNLNAVAEDMLRMLRRIIGERIEVRTALDAANPAILGDAGGIEQVIMNLSVNARDAMPDGGILLIGTETVEIAPHAVGSAPGARAGRFVRLSVQDSGSGMDPATAARIYEPFFTTKGVGRGTGLGLSVVYGIVKQHGGWIDLHTAPGEGTRFDIHLPLTQHAASSSPSQAALEHLRGAGERLLVVEDEEGFRGVMAEGLRSAGYVVVECSRVRQALELLEAAGGDYRAVIADVVLGDGDGLDLAAHIRTRRPELPVLLSSGYTDESSQIQRIHEEGLPFLPKPYSFSALLLAIRQLLATRSE